MTIRPLLLAALLAGAATPALAQDYDYSRSGYRQDDGRDIRSVADFDAPLARYGRWVPSRWGRAWSPNVGRDWRPYTVGHWVDSPDGDLWESDEPWGWATYHYGRWGFDDRQGWVWVPDTEWAPAWVAWRDGDDVAGWAPLPPQSGYGYDTDAWDYGQWYAPSWVYVPRASLYRRGVGGFVLPWRGNRNYWQRTRGSHRDDDRDGRRDRPGYHNGPRPGGPNWNGNPPRPGDRPDRPGNGGRPPYDPQAGRGDRPGGNDRPDRDGRPGRGDRPDRNDRPGQVGGPPGGVQPHPQNGNGRPPPNRPQGGFVPPNQGGQVPGDRPGRGPQPNPSGVPDRGGNPDRGGQHHDRGGPPPGSVTPPPPPRPAAGPPPEVKPARPAPQPETKPDRPHHNDPRDDRKEKKPD